MQKQYFALSINVYQSVYASGTVIWKTAEYSLYNG